MLELFWFFLTLNGSWFFGFLAFAISGKDDFLFRVFLELLSNSSSFIEMLCIAFFWFLVALKEANSVLTSSASSWIYMKQIKYFSLYDANHGKLIINTYQSLISLRPHKVCFSRWKTPCLQSPLTLYRKLLCHSRPATMNFPFVNK